MVAHYEFRKEHGAELQSDGSVLFRLWAPSVDSVSLEIHGAGPLSMEKAPEGWHVARAPCVPNARYGFRLPDGLFVPDPASRLQDGGVHGPSVVVDPRSFTWRHTSWTGRPWHEAVLYELHPGACGGFSGITRLLPYLHELGVTAIELMPIAACPGQRNWGYDGVLPYAPNEAYGTPDELKTLIDTAHGIGLSVLLDVVYNHFGPDGAYPHVYAKPFFDERTHTPWGAAIDFTRPEVRGYFIQNALYWLEEYRFDGLRFDATHAITPQSFLDDMAAEIRRAFGNERSVCLVLEHEGNIARHLQPGRYDAQWSDDFHHCVHVLLTGEHEGYYGDFQQAATLLARCLAEGFAYQGEMSGSGKPRGEPSAGLPTTAFVICLQNHDQIGNRAFGERLTTLADANALRAASALQLLTPQIPLLFMGEEWGAREPFLYFTDHNAELAEAVRNGRREEFRRFAAFQDPARRNEIPDPNDLRTFERSIPDFGAAAAVDHGQTLSFYRRLLAIRRDEIVPRMPGCRSLGAEAIGGSAVRGAWQMHDGTTLTIAANLGRSETSIAPIPGYLLAESGAGPADAIQRGILPGHSTVAFLSEVPG